MKLNKKMLAIALGISSCGLIIGMEEKANKTPKYYFEVQDHPIVSVQAKKLAYFAREYQKDNNPTSVLSVAQWLVYSQNDFGVTNQWTEFMNLFVFHLTGNHCLCDCVKNKKLDAMVKTIKETTYERQLTDDYPQLLVTRTQEAMLKAEQEFNSSLNS